MSYHEIELRPMQPGEEAAVFNLLEHSFGEPASFFRERELAVPFPCEECHWVAVQGSLVVAHAVYYPAESRGPKGTLKIGILANVCTHSDYRGQGIAARLVERVSVAMQEAGLDFGCLMGHTDYYSRFGYVDNAPESRYYFSGDPLTTALVRPGSVNDIAWQTALYDKNTAERLGSMLRTQAYWESASGLSYVESLVREAKDGYAVLSYYRPPGWALEELHLLEIEAASNEAAEDLFRAALKRAGSHAAQLLWSVGPHPYRDRLLEAGDEYLQDSQTTPGFMWKKLREESGVEGPLYLSHMDIR